MRSLPVFALLIAAHVLLQAFVLTTHRIPVSSDQAVVGLMAKHILEGKGHPVFYYGATYAGSLEPHYVALVFALLKPSVAAYRIAMEVLVAIFVAGIWLFSRRFFGSRAGTFAFAYLAVPPFFFLYKGLTSDGAYDSVALLSLAMIALALWIDERASSPRGSAMAWTALGGTMGAAFWVMPHTAAVSAAVLVWLVLGRRARAIRAGDLAALAGGAAAGASPWWIWNLRHGWVSLKAAELGTVSLAQAARNLRTLAGISLPTLEGGMFATPDTTAVDQIFPFSRILCLAALAILVAPALLRAIRRDQRCLLLVLCLAAAFFAACFSARLVPTEPRYLFAYYALVPPLAGLGLQDLTTDRRGRRVAMAAASVLLTIHAASVLKSLVAYNNTEGEITGSIAPLVRALEGSGLHEAYTSYWTAYRLSFESGERIVATPLPDDASPRYLPYVTRVNASANPAVVLVQRRSACFAAALRERQLPFARQQAAEFGIFSDLPPSVLDAIRSGRGLPLPERAYRVAWVRIPSIPSMAAGGSRSIDVKVRNDGLCVWPPSVHLAYHWRPLSSGLPEIYDGPRGFPNQPLYPHQTESIAIPLVAPGVPGRYRLEYELVEENVTWFSAKGGSTASYVVEIR